jgi:hypothetical protein
MGAPAGAFLGLHASGLPSGAQHVPVTVPCGEVKLQSVPLLSDLHDASASAGGLGGPPLPSVVCADRPQHAVSAAAHKVRPMARLMGKLKMDLAFMDLLWVGRQAPALP